MQLIHVTGKTSNPPRTWQSRVFTQKVGSHPGSQEIACILRNPVVHYYWYIHDSVPCDLVLYQINPLYILTLFPCDHAAYYLPLPRSPNWSLPFIVHLKCMHFHVFRTWVCILFSSSFLTWSSSCYWGNSINVEVSQSAVFFIFLGSK